MREREDHLMSFPTGPPAKLLFANRVDIRAVETSGKNYELLVKHLYNAIAVDFHYRSVDKLGIRFWQFSKSTAKQRKCLVREIESLNVRSLSWNVIHPTLVSSFNSPGFYW